MLIILDASSIISFLLSKKKSNIRDIIQLGYDKKLTFIISDETYSELKKKISASKIKDSKFYNEKITGKFIAWYKYNTKNVSLDLSKNIIRSRDSKDDVYLLLAKVSKSSYLITFDDDLLVLKKVGKTKIVTPEQFMKMKNKM